MQAELFIAGATTPKGHVVDIAIAGERILSVEPAGRMPPADRRIDAAGHVVSPSFVEGHIHLDKTLIGLPFIPHIPGDSVAERIAAGKARLLAQNVDQIGGALLDLLRGTIENNATIIRSQGIGAESGISGGDAGAHLRACRQMGRHGGLQAVFIRHRDSCTAIGPRARNQQPTRGQLINRQSMRHTVRHHA